MAPGSPGTESELAREFAGDCWGYGTFPGQYGMCLLVDDRLTLQSDKARTFRLFPWDYMHSATLPTTEDGKPWYDPEEIKRLFGDNAQPSSFAVKSSVTTPGGVVLTRYERSGEVRTGSYGL